MLDHYRHQRIMRFHLPRKTLNLVGEFRFSESNAVPRLRQLAAAEDLDRTVDGIFRDLRGEYCIVVEEGSIVSVYVGYSHPQFYIFESNFEQRQTIKLTTSEDLTLHQDIDPGRLFLRTVSHHSLYIPRGLGAATKDFLLPGMCMRICTDTCSYTQSWVYPFDEITSIEDHHQIAREVADSLASELSSFRHYEDQEPLTLQLSSGLDSALLLAASRSAGLQSQLINFETVGRVEEHIGARAMAKFFGQGLTVLARGPAKGHDRFSNRTDISDYIQRTKDLLKKGSGLFILDNLSLLGGYYLGCHRTLEGSTYPTQLCLVHNTVYPRVSLRKGNLFPRFRPSLRSEKRHTYSQEYASKLINEQGESSDYWGIGDQWPEIHPYYWRFLGFCYTAIPVGGGEMNPKQFPFLNVMNNGAGLYFDLKRNGNEILSKILLHEGLRKSLEVPSEVVATRIGKIISFILKAVWSHCRQHNYGRAEILHQYRPGLCSDMLRILHRATIDRQLTEYPKWHLFEAFKLLAGKSFFEINRFTPTKVAMRSGTMKLRPREKPLKSRIFENDSVKAFWKQSRIDDIFDAVALRCSRERRSTLNEITLAAQGDSRSRFWLMSNKLNIGLLLGE